MLLAFSLWASYTYDFRTCWKMRLYVLLFGIAKCLSRESVAKQTKARHQAPVDVPRPIEVHWTHLLFAASLRTRFSMQFFAFLLIGDFWHWLFFHSVFPAFAFATFRFTFAPLTCCNCASRVGAIVFFLFSFSFSFIFMASKSVWSPGFVRGGGHFGGKRKGTRAELPAKVWQFGSRSLKSQAKAEIYEFNLVFRQIAKALTPNGSVRQRGESRGRLSD